LLNRSRNTLDTSGRIKVFATLAAEAAQEIPIVYLYHRNWLWAHNKKLSGLKTIPDGLVRVQGVKM
jgi:peptide/nickel transport system substrate-binding protein